MRYVRGYRARRRDRIAARTLNRAAGICDNCGTTHGERHGPLIACTNGIAVRRECQQDRGFKPYGGAYPGAQGAS